MSGNSGYREARDRLRPPRLRPSGEIRIIAPSSYPDILLLSESVEGIRRLGYRISYGINIKKLNQESYHAASPETRAKELMDAFLDDHVDLIFCARGGHGAMQILPYIDFDLIRDHPKAFVGYSDITSLHMAINKFSGLVTFHGPMPASDPEEFQGEKMGTMFGIFSGEVADLTFYLRRLVKYVTEGSSTGVSSGTNFSVFSSLTGTPYMPNLQGKILFMEDTNTRAVDIERYLDIMVLNHSIEKISGFVFGEFKNRPQPSENTPSIEDIIREYMHRYSIISLAAAPFGHGREQMLIPLNLKMRIQETYPYIEPMESMVE